MTRDRRGGLAGGAAGLSLVELLVATTILAIAATIALVLYDGARQSYKVGENVSEQQQAVRIAFDLVSSDVRQAGFNVNPDGIKTRPDEAIEGAYDTAIVVRADFDAGDPAESLVPETSLAAGGSAFNVVPTGNDEIRAYVLAKTDGSSTSTLSYQADVGQAVRDGVVETVDLPNVALTHGDPPYTLYRITLDGAAAPQRTVLIENVKSLRFRYYDRAGNLVAAPGGQDDDAGVRGRARIRRVGVEIEALTRDPDMDWRDANDPNAATRAYRKFKLAGDVTPPNLGLVGIPDFQSDLTPPGAPALPQLYPGHCGGLYISWPANPPADGTSYYRVRFGTDPGDLAEQRVVDGTGFYLGGLDEGVTYHVAIQAVDAAGNQSPLGPVASQTTQNSNYPELPLNAASWVDVDGRVNLAWDAVTENTAATVGDPQSPLIRELAGYRVYRGESAGFTPGASNLIADEAELLALPTPGFVDNTTIACRDYWYQVVAVDECGLEGAFSAEVSGTPPSTAQPLAPTDVLASFISSATKRLQWSPVGEDVNGDTIRVDEYHVYRTPLMLKTDVPTVPDDFILRAVITGATTHVEVVWESPVETVWYIVKAVDDCPNASEFSDPPVEPTCFFAGVLSIEQPDYGREVWGETDIVVRVEDQTSGTLTEMRLTIEDETTGFTDTFTYPGPGPVWTHTWNAQTPAFQEGPHRIHVEIDQHNTTPEHTCTATASLRVHVTDPGAGG